MLRKGIIEGGLELPVPSDLYRTLEPNLSDVIINHDTLKQVGSELDNILLASVSAQVSRMVTFLKSNSRFFSICSDT